MVLPPCYIPTTVKTTGWRPTRLDKRYALFVPPTFVRDSTAWFHHGGRAWKDGEREISWSVGYYGEESFGDPGGALTPGYAECPDTLESVPVRIITTYNRAFRHFMVVVMPETTMYAPGGGPVLVCQSPDSADQHLFLTIVRRLSVVAKW
jgi:hypothetical protein